MRYGRFTASLPYERAPLPARTKIFLVAGGAEVANFAEEVVRQRRLWQQRGFAPDEIACYWARPDADDYRRDLRQYRRLAAELRHCYPASAALLRAHLGEASGRGLPFVYLYVTSHGSADLLPVDVPEDSLLPTDRALLDQYALQMGAGVGRGIAPGPLTRALRGGADPADLVFSPRVLQALLRAFPAATPKYVVLQACHSGGFLNEVRPAKRDEAISAVPGVTAIAAARHDRTSFGCQAGARMTFFGAVFLAALQAREGDPTRVDWAGLFAAVRQDVEALEQVAGVVPSEPVFVRPR